MCKCGRLVGRNIGIRECDGTLKHLGQTVGGGIMDWQSVIPMRIVGIHGYIGAHIEGNLPACLCMNGDERVPELVSMVVRKNEPGISPHHMYATNLTPHAKDTTIEKTNRYLLRGREIRAIDHIPRSKKRGARKSGVSIQALNILRSRASVMMRVRHSGHSLVLFMIRSEHARHIARCL